VRKSRFSVEQIVAVLRQVEMGMPIADVTRQLGISEQTFYRWKKAYGGLQPDQARELKQLQEENARLKKLVADLSLDKVILQDIAAKSGAARAEARCGELHGQPPPHQRASGLQAREAASQRALLPQRQGSEAGAAKADARAGAGSDPLRLSAHPCAAAP
jgi:putative transposase